MLDNIALFQESLEYKFKNQDLLKTALTRRSYSCEYSLKYCNERMEFLGDSILSAIVCEYLYNKYSQNDEGKLSQIKAQIVSSKNLSKWAKKIKLDKFVLISKSEEKNSARNRESLLCDSFEAVTGAIFLDSDFETVSKFVNSFLSSQKDITITDYKTTLQEVVQAKFQTLPEYKVIKESGPDHDKTFEIAVYIKEKFFGKGKGNSKKHAEQMAASFALKKIK